jgi:hypothetical protein
MSTKPWGGSSDDAKGGRTRFPPSGTALPRGCCQGAIAEGRTHFQNDRADAFQDDGVAAVDGTSTAFAFEPRLVLDDLRDIRKLGEAARIVMEDAVHGSGVEDDAINTDD